MFSKAAALVGQFWQLVLRDDQMPINRDKAIPLGVKFEIHPPVYDSIEPKARTGMFAWSAGSV